MQVVGVPERSGMSRARVSGLIFDLDGVISNTSSLHMAAWIRAVREHEALISQVFRRPFSAADYESMLSGRSRISGLENVAEVRNWSGASQMQLEKVSNKKNKYFRELVATIDPADLLFEDSMSFITANEQVEARLALCSSSKNARYILNRAGLEGLFEVIVDGHVIEDQKLAPKPSPEPFIRCMSLLGASWDSTIIFEDAEAGLISALAAKARVVVFVNRANILPSKIKKIRSDWLQDETELIVVRDFYELDAYEDKLCIA